MMLSDEQSESRMRIVVVLAVTATMIGLAGPAWLQSALPDLARTPGALNPAVTQANIDEAMCVRGWSARGDVMDRSLARWAMVCPPVEAWRKGPTRAGRPRREWLRTAPRLR